VVTLVVPIANTLPSEGTPVPLTTPTVPLQTVMAQPKTRLLPEWLRANQEEQSVLQADTERKATQRWGDRAVIEAHLVELHQHKFALEAERAIMVNSEGAVPYLC
jgi:hypothetical protein